MASATESTATASASAGEPDPGNKAYWGPRLWRMFHLLAEVSDRNDLYLLWPVFLRLTATIMPCAACRHHLGTYLRTHVIARLPAKKPATGPAVQARIRADLFALHNDVNTRLGKPVLPEAELRTLYEVSETHTRATRLAEIAALYEEIRGAWTPQHHLRAEAGAYNEWKRNYQMIFALASGGPTA